MTRARVFHLVPHTHWDREWYLPRAAFHARLVPALDDLLDRLAADPAYRTFLLDGQTVHAEDYLRARPDREAGLRELVAAGRLQLGPWYVLADEQIPSGEALVRNLLLGGADAEQLGGRLDVLYSPDAFGHPPIGPTLAHEFRLRYAVLWRGHGGEAGQEGDLFRWRGPDGAAVLVYHLPPDGYEVGAALPADAVRLAAAWAPLRRTLVGRASTPHVAVFVGADHHAAHSELPTVRDRLAELEPAADVRISRLDEFLAAADAAAAEGGVSLPEVRGELRWSYRYTWTLQGVHATRTPQKRRNAELELCLERLAEPLAALARRAGGRDRRPLLALAWRALVRSHFHDAIGGCASDEVARAVDARFDAVAAYGAELARSSLDELVGHDPDRARAAPDTTRPMLVLWNPAARRRGGLVVADVTCFRRDVFIGPPSAREPGRGPGFRPFGLVAPDGTAIPVQVLGRRRALERTDAARHYPDLDEVDEVRIAFEAPELPGMAVAMSAPGSSVALPRTGVVDVRGSTIENGIVSVTIGRDGALALRDLRTGERYERLLALECGGDIGDTYTYCPPNPDRLRRSAGPVRLRTLASGPLVATLEAEWRMAAGRAVDGKGDGEIGLRLTVSLLRGSPAVRCTLELDNRAKHHRLRARLPIGVSGAAVAGAQFGAVGRAPVTVEAADYPRETPVRTAPAHRYVAAAAAHRGLVLMAPGFFEYEWTAGGELLFTVLRAVGELSRGDLATRPGHAGWPVATPLAQCPGTDRLQLVIVPVDAALAAAPHELQRLWEDAFLPVRGRWIRHATMPVRGSAAGAGSVMAAGSIELAGEGLVLSTIKPAERGDGMVLRCYNTLDRPVAGAWRLGEPVRRAVRTRADEREDDGDAIATTDGGTTIPFTAGPRGMVTIRVE